MESTVDTAVDVDEWRKLVASQGVEVIPAIVLNYFSKRVCPVFSRSGGMHGEVSEEMCREALLRPLEALMCDKDPGVGLDELKQLNAPTSLCGKVFKSSEPTYSCRDCGADGTCVLCGDCFQRSEHKTHRYRMCTSSGSGCCDCGDVEAWKQHPYCSLHQPRPDSQPRENPDQLLPAVVQERAAVLFETCVKFAIDLLTWTNDLPRPAELPDHSENSHMLLLYNDEVHTFDEVIHGLMAVCNHAQEHAIHCATIVDRDGRLPVSKGDRSRCVDMKRDLQARLSRAKPIRVEVLPSDIVAHQLFAVHLLHWLKELSNLSDGLRHILVTVVMKRQPDGLSLLDKALLVDSQLWKVARMQCQTLFMSTMIMDPGIKREFAVRFTQNYCSIQKAFLADDHEHSISVSSMSVQLYTVPTLAQMLFVNHDVLHIIAGFYTDQFQPYIVDGQLNIAGSRKKLSLARLTYIIHDFKYVLKHVVPTNWTDKTRDSFRRGLKHFLTLFKAMQGMEPFKRQESRHLEYEPEWEMGLNLQLQLEHVLPHLLRWISSDLTVLLQTIDIINDTIKNTADYKVAVKDKRSIGGSEVVMFNVMKESVSLYWPLTRFLAGILVSAFRFDLRLEELMQHEEQVLPWCQYLLEQPLRVLLVAHQVNSNLWRRNGYGLLNQVQHYQSVLFRKFMYDMDVAMLQICAAVMQPEAFMLTLLARCNVLNTWYNVDFETSKKRSEDGMQLILSHTQMFFHLLILVFGERFNIGIAEVSDRTCLEREVIHLLCLKPMTHSDILKRLPHRIDQGDGDNEEQEYYGRLDTILAKIATFRAPGATTKGHYELKEEYYKQYSPFFYHYTKQDQSKGEEHRRQRAKSAKGSPPVATVLPRLLPCFRRQFLPILRLASCSVLQRMLTLLFWRVLNPASNAWNESILQEALYFVAMICVEEDASLNRVENRRPDMMGPDAPYKMLVRAQEPSLLPDCPSIIDLIKSLHEKPVISADNQDLIKFIIQHVQTLHGGSSIPLSPSADSTKDQGAASSAMNDPDRRRKAADRRAAALLKLKQQQQQFLEQTMRSLNDTNTELSPTGQRAPLTMDDRSAIAITSKSTDGTPVDFADMGEAVANALKLSQPAEDMMEVDSQPLVCIYCKEPQELDGSGPAMVVTAAFQRSKVFSQMAYTTSSNTEFEPLLMPSTLPVGTLVMSCGHALHAHCWQSLMDDKVKDRRRHGYFPVMGEFLCPVCLSISNTVIPLLPRTHHPPMLPMNSIADSVTTTVQLLTCLLEQSAVEQPATPSRPEENPLPPPQPGIASRLLDRLRRGGRSGSAASVATTSVVTTATAAEQVVTFADQLCAKLTCEQKEKEVDKDQSAKKDTSADLRQVDVCWEMCAFSIIAVEQLLRTKNRNLFDLSSRQSDSLSAIVPLCATVRKLCSPSLSLSTSEVRFLSVLLGHSQLPKEETILPSVLQLDAFHLLVSLTFFLSDTNRLMEQSENAVASSTDELALHFATMLHFIQVLLIKIPKVFTGTPSSVVPPLSQLRHDLLRQLGMEVGDGVYDEEDLSRLVEDGMVVFLRQATLFLHFHGLPQPLHDVDTSSFASLCTHLGLPNTLSALANGCFLNADSFELVKRWCASLQPAISHVALDKALCLQKTRGLIPLPKDYSDLVHRVADFRCPQAVEQGLHNTLCLHPSICLVCGQIMCSRGYCCRVDVGGNKLGPNSYHALCCGCGYGMFLWIREGELLILASERGTIIAPPYLDAYGEPDAGLRRGNPLYLNEDRYQALEKLWVSHGLLDKVVNDNENSHSYQLVTWSDM